MKLNCLDQSNKVLFITKTKQDNDVTDLHVWFKLKLELICNDQSDMMWFIMKSR